MNNICLNNKLKHKIKNPSASSLYEIVDKSGREVNDTDVCQGPLFFVPFTEKAQIVYLNAPLQLFFICSRHSVCNC